MLKFIKTFNKRIIAAGFDRKGARRELRNMKPTVARGNSYARILM
jgi:hypothetical protein